MRILIVEDDSAVGEALRSALPCTDYAVDLATNGQIADMVLQDAVFDLLILDLSLPRLDGFEVLRRLRARGSTVPVLVLSACDSEDAKVRSLDLGADDYLVKPFGLRELRARVRALLRRGPCGVPVRISHAGLSFDTVSRSIYFNDRLLPFSARETGILEVLLRNGGRPVSKEHLLDRLYNFDQEASFNTIEVSIHRLRKKLEGTATTIRTLHGCGYALECQPADAGAASQAFSEKMPKMPDVSGARTLLS
ncbi:MAG: DNA-binding response regulator [Rhodocyclaceae bacterium]|jgi:two-component system OmpR family response regulator|nr:DNA-binding response regulator [Rhodocyclaceae bacterium]